MNSAGYYVHQNASYLYQDMLYVGVEATRKLFVLVLGEIITAVFVTLPKFIQPLCIDHVSHCARGI